MQTLGQVEPYQQIQPYSCGAATLKAVTRHWGADFDEAMLIKLIDIDPNNGSTVDQVTRAARKLGFDAAPWKFDSIDELKTYTDRDVPVIIAVRSFTKPNQGHFVVAVDVDDTGVEMMDPNTRGNWRRVSRRELDDRWQFRDRYGIIVQPKAPRRAGLGQAGGGSARPWIWAAVGGAAVAGLVYWAYRRKA